ncbi:hypothetical protein EDC01DRAFT_631774 [Geopyxis carbonaria]|nr:hypothetical protein EDC01DRAFT_631774 [Geopyxis carbonaria]
MNDPGLDEPLQHTAQETERTLRKQLNSNDAAANHDAANDKDSPSACFRRELQRANTNDPATGQDGYFQPKRWWFTSTAFPLIAGTFGPLANLMSVCALVQSWRVEFTPGVPETEGARVADPAWLLAVNAVSLAFAIVANMLLLLNFAHRVPYRVAQPLTIVFWLGPTLDFIPFRVYISSITLIAIVIAASLHLQLHPKNAYAFSQSFYYGIISAVLYFTISTLLLWNMLGAYLFKAYPPTFTSLTIPQRTLMLQTIMYSFYLALGAGVFSRLEGWDFVDGVYWADYTLLTIGLGTDFPLATTVAKALLIPYAVVGIIMIGLVIGSIRGLFLERGKTKVRRRALHKEARRMRAKMGSCEWKREFELMRDVQAAADRRRRYYALSTSLLAFLIVWLGGALVFSFSERGQSWSYFQALYFSYTSLLTIGYGDYYPKSNAGKPFFVIWSLVAIPSVTVLISNMGDTIVGWVKHGTLWIGQKTILPERTSAFKSADDMAATDDATFHEADGAVDDGDAGSGADHWGPHALTSRIAKEIKALALDIGAKPPRRYEWDDWERFLQLLGEENEAEAEWTWLSNEGPLLSGVSETEWVLGKMCERFEAVLRQEEGERGNRGGKEKGS